jgi:hypothetical protein
MHLKSDVPGWGCLPLLSRAVEELDKHGDTPGPEVEAGCDRLGRHALGPCGRARCGDTVVTTLAGDCDLYRTLCSASSRRDDVVLLNCCQDPSDLVSGCGCTRGLTWAGAVDGLDAVVGAETDRLECSGKCTVLVLWHGVVDGRARGERLVEDAVTGPGLGGRALGRGAVTGIHPIRWLSGRAIVLGRNYPASARSRQ